MQRRGEKLYEKLPQLWRVTAVKNCPRDMGGNRSVLQSSSVFVVCKYDFYIILKKSGKSNALETEARPLRLNSGASRHDLCNPETVARPISICQ